MIKRMPVLTSEEKQMSEHLSTEIYFRLSSMSETGQSTYDKK